MALMTGPEEHKRTADSCLGLATDLSCLLATGLERKGWTPMQLAHAVRSPVSAIVAVVESTHGNVSLAFVTRLLDALGMTATLVEKRR